MRNQYLRCPLASTAVRSLAVRRSFVVLINALLAGTHWTVLQISGVLVALAQTQIVVLRTLVLNMFALLERRI